MTSSAAAAPAFARRPARLSACWGALLLLAAFGARAELSTHDSDAVLPNSPFKERGMPDAGQFNPAEGPAVAERLIAVPGTAADAPAAMTYYPPAIVLDAPPARRPNALVAAPTLPCAPGYCPRPRPRADRN